MVAINLMPAGGYGAALAQSGQEMQRAQLPTSTAAPPSNAPQEKEKSTAAWKQYLTRAMADPNMRLALARAGAVMLQPTRRGQSELSKVADGILAGMTSYQGSQAAQAQAASEAEKMRWEREMDLRKQQSLEASRAATQKWREENLKLSRQRLGARRGTTNTRRDLKLELDLLKLTEGLYPYPPEPDTLMIPAEQLPKVMEQWQQRVDDVDAQRAAYMERRRMELGLEAQETPEPVQAMAAAPTPATAASTAASTPKNLQQMLQQGTVTEDEFVNAATQVYRQLNPNLTAQDLGKVRLLAMKQWRDTRATQEQVIPESRTAAAYARQDLPTAFFGIKAAARRKELTPEMLQDFKARVQTELQANPGDKKLQRMLEWAKLQEKKL